MTTPSSRNDILDDMVTLAVVTMHQERYMDDGGHASGADALDGFVDDLDGLDDDVETTHTLGWSPCC